MRAWFAAQGKRQDRGASSCHVRGRRSVGRRSPEPRTSLVFLRQLRRPALPARQANSKAPDTSLALQAPTPALQQHHSTLRTCYVLPPNSTSPTKKRSTSAAKAAKFPCLRQHARSER